MKVASIIIWALALLASSSVSAQRVKPDTAAYAAKVIDVTLPVEISVFENRIRVENAPVGSMLEIYSVVGIKVKELEVKQPSGEYVVDIAKGYYIVRIGETVRKIAIR